jgi:hypothetical protein
MLPMHQASPHLLDGLCQVGDRKGTLKQLLVEKI